MAQPIKKINKIQDNFSKELSVLLDYIVDNFVKIHGVNKITPEIFVYMCLEYKDSICYKVINTILNENDIEILHDEINDLFDNTSDIINGKLDLLKDEDFKKIAESDGITIRILKNIIEFKLANN